VTARLGQAGLLERLPDERDGRGARLRLTPEGRRTLRGLRSRKTAYLAERLERLDPEERAVLEQASELLERLLEDGGE
jgi:DNA-binding MarR family transcriptional regulator